MPIGAAEALSGRWFMVGHAFQEKHPVRGHKRPGRPFVSPQSGKPIQASHLHFLKVK